MKRSKAFWYFYALVLLAFLGSSTALGLRSAELRRGSAFYAGLEETSPASAASAESSPPMSAARPAAPGEPEREAVPLRPGEPSLRLARFAEEYPDAVLWLQLPDTALDYPVMLGTDNQFYLDHLPDGDENALGSLFLDCRTHEDSVHLIVYGHNGAGGKMFGLLKQYESQDYFLEHKTLILAAPDNAYVCPIFSVRRVEAGGGAYQLEFGDGGSLSEYIDQAAADSLYPVDVELGAAARVLTLSTCTGWRGERFIVQALIPA
nr:class B sortase [uncultured Oscillibacter sp.]